MMYIYIFILYIYIFTNYIYVGPRVHVLWTARTTDGVYLLSLFFDKEQQTSNKQEHWCKKMEKLTKVGVIDALSEEFCI